MNNKKYKISMFVKEIETDDGGLLLYSSYLGLKNVVNIERNNIQKVRDWINLKEIAYQNDPAFEKLVSYGYLVDSNVDEKLLRQNLINETLYDNNLNLIIHTTEDCNFRCEYCALDFVKRPLDANVAKSIVTFIRKNISKYSSVTISWFGGEPLLNINAIEEISKEVISICKCAKKEFYASITTNGYLLTKKNVDTLYRCHVREFIVTVDGNRNTHDKQRHLKNGNPTFDRIIANLQEIKENKKLHVKIVMRTNVSKEILDSLEEYYKYVDNEFGDDRRFDMFLRLVGDWGGDRIKNMKDSLLSVSAYTKIFDILKTRTDKLKLEMNGLDFEPSGCACQAMRKNKFTIAVDGNIYKCDSPVMSIGVLTNDGKMQIDESLNCLWSLPCNFASKKCDNCFFSCACFMGSCPKNMIDNKNNYQCSSFVEGLDNYIKALVQFKNIKSI